MERQSNSSRAKKVASEIDAKIRALPVQNTPSVRAIRRQYSRKLMDKSVKHRTNLIEAIAV